MSRMLSTLISELTKALAENGDLPVMLTVTNNDGADECHGDVTGVTVEDNHSTEELFVRIAGDDEE